jgi:hypothetical protein
LVRGSSIISSLMSRTSAILLRAVPVAQKDPLPLQTHQLGSGDWNLSSEALGLLFYRSLSLIPDENSRSPVHPPWPVTNGVDLELRLEQDILLGRELDVHGPQQPLPKSSPT